LAPYLVGLCIFPFPTTVATMVFYLTTKKRFSILLVLGRARMGDLLWGDYSNYHIVGSLKEGQILGFMCFSRCVGIHRFISKTWPLKYKLQKEFQKIHIIFLRKIRRGVLDVWNTKTISNLGSPSTQHTHGRRREFDFLSNNYNMYHKTICDKL
jgi:hypothetical protein